MDNIISELYYGKIRPFEKKLKKSSEYARLSGLLKEKEKEIMKYFDDNKLKKPKKIFSEYINADGYLSDISEFESFSDGFKLGLRLSGVLCENESIFD